MNFFASKFEENYPQLDNIIRGVLASSGWKYEDKPTKYRFKCALCGDSSWSRKKMRGYILKKKTPWMYYCHNCGYKKPVTSWLKEFHNTEYKQYMKSVYKADNNTVDDAEIQKRLYEELREKSIHEEMMENYQEDLEARKYFIGIMDDHIVANEARKYLTNRKIDQSVWGSWMVATGGTYLNRIIIPYFTPQDKVYYFQARHLYGAEPKYLFAKYCNPNYYPIYNYYKIDISQPVSILEGPIDSEFVDNAIAVGGIKPDLPGLEHIPQKIYVLDWDKSGVDGIIRLLKGGHRVFDWVSFINDYNLPKRSKWDINDVIEYLGIPRLTLDVILDYTIEGAYNAPKLLMYWEMNKV